MPPEEILESLSRFTDWPVEQLKMHAELSDKPPADVMEWLLELVQLFETRSEQRAVILYLPDLYKACGNDLTRTKQVLDTPPYNIFTPMELLELGLPYIAVSLAKDVLDPQRIEEDRKNPFFSTTMPRHAMPWTIHDGLGGQMGMVVAEKWEAHIAKCAGCRDNATDFEY